MLPQEAPRSAGCPLVILQPARVVDDNRSSSDTRVGYERPLGSGWSKSGSCYESACVFGMGGMLDKWMLREASCGRDAPELLGRLPTAGS